jgi:hypothetical protein
VFSDELIAANGAYASFAATFLGLRRYFCPMMCLRFVFTALAVFFSFQVFAQKPDSLQLSGADSLSPASYFPAERDSVFKDLQAHNDTLPLEKKKGFVNRVFTKGYPNPRTAALFSAVLPGAGQAYNKKWWKVPLVWGILGGITYFTFDTQNTYRELRDAYEIIANGGTPESPYDAFDAIRLKSYRDTFRGYTEKWYLALGVTYLLNVTDAFVDAHLTQFDVSDDLSMRIKPSVETSAGLPVFGLGISFSISNPRPHHTLSFSAHP